MNSIKKIHSMFKKIIKKKQLSYILLILLILYISRLSGNNRFYELNILSDIPLVKFVILTVILLVSVYNVNLGILLTIAYLSTLFMYRRSINQIESFANQEDQEDQEDSEDETDFQFQDKITEEDEDSKESEESEKQNELLNSHFQSEYQEQLLQNINTNELSKKRNKQDLEQTEGKSTVSIQLRKLNSSDPIDKKYIKCQEKANEIINRIKYKYDSNFQDLDSVIEHRINDMINILNLVSDDEDEDED